MADPILDPKPTPAGAEKKSRFEVLEADDIEIVSVCTGRRVSLDVAVRERWLVCAHCGAPYDAEDLAALAEVEGAEARCVSDVCRNRRTPLVTAPLPVDRIVVFAQSRMHENFSHGLIFKLFYASDTTRVSPHFTLREEEDAKPMTEPVVEPTIREENWSNRGLVITKRRRGRFISWVPLGG